jgi:flavorubredoxin
MSVAIALPREIVPGIFWLGQCLLQPWQGETLHNYNSAYLVRGERCSVLVEAGHPQDLAVIESQLEQLLADGPPLRYLFSTHQETPHSAGIGRVLARYPEVEICGDVRDYHLFFPGLVDRLRPMAIGESIDIGGGELRIVESAIRDLPSTQWAFDTARRALFPGDGFAYSHFHATGQCGHTAEEVPELAVRDMAGLFAELALHWTRFNDTEPYVADLEAMLRRLEVELIVPTHGLPITDLERTVPIVLDGLRRASAPVEA